MNLTGSTSTSENCLSQLLKQKKLTELSNLALNMTNEKEFLDLFCTEVTLITKCDLTGVYKYEISSNRFLLVASCQPHFYDNLNVLLNEPNTLIGYTFLKTDPVFYDDIKDNEDLSNSPLLMSYTIGAGISCTIKNSQGKWGVFGSLSFNEKKLFKQDGEFFQSLANILGLFLERNYNQDKLLKSYSLEAAIRLTSSVGHDFNNYLTIIKNNLDLLELDFLKEHILTDEEKTKVINANLLAIKKSGDLLQQLQSLNKNLSTNYVVIDLNEILITMKDLLVMKWKIKDDKKVDFSYYLTSDSPLLIKGDSSQLSQVILNIVTNAIEAINTENGKIEIKTEKLLQTDPNNRFEIAHLGLTPTNYVHLSISDNGIGMNKEFLGTIFTPYITGKKVNSTTGHNLGLGLSIVYNIMNQMNSTIKVTSEINKGTKFDIFFPSLN